MSTEIHSASDPEDFWITLDGRSAIAERVKVLAYREGIVKFGASLTRADFLATVAFECGVIVIDRADLPEVTDVGSGTWRFGASGSSLSTNSDKTAEGAREEALELLALADYLDAHPPIDSEQVEALTAALIDADMDGPSGPTPYTVARRLVAEGWSK